MYSKQQRGFSLPVAIFILVIMALIGAAMVSIMQTSQQSLSSEVLSTRAFYAAESGAQLALAQLFPLDGSPANCSASYPTQIFTSNGLAGCSASVTCSSLTASARTFYTLRSTGVCSVSDSRASREVEVMAKGP